MGSSSWEWKSIREYDAHHEVKLRESQSNGEHLGLYDQNATCGSKCSPNEKQHLDDETSVHDDVTKCSRQ